MVSGSRFESERVRRVVVAGVMAVLLAGSTALAVVFSARSHRRSHPPMAGVTLGAFTFNAPAKWAQQAAVVPDRNVVAARAFTEPRSDRLLLVSDLRFTRPVSPDFAMTELLTRESADPQRIVQGQALRYGPMSGLLVESVDTRRHGGGWRLLAAITLDGRRYLGLSLAKDHTPDAADLVLFYRITESIKDTRYTAVGGKLALAGVGTLAVPPGMLAFELHESGRAVPLYLLTPRGDDRFYTLELTPLPDSIEKAVQRATPSAENSLASVLAWRYREMTRAMPAASSLKGEKTDRSQIFALPVGLSRRTLTYVEFWGVQPTGSKPVLLDITASQAATAAAQQAALTVARAVSPP